MSEVIDLRFATEATQAALAGYTGMLLSTQEVSKAMLKRNSGYLNSTDKRFVAAVQNKDLTDWRRTKPQNDADQRLKDLQTEMGLATVFGACAITYLCSPKILPPESAATFQRYEEITAEISEWVIGYCTPQLQVYADTKEVVTFAGFMRSVQSSFAAWVPTVEAMDRPPREAVQ